MALRLAAAEVVGPRTRLWRLYDGDEVVGDHQVSVEPCWEWDTLRDLPVGVARQVDPADRLGSEASLAARVGRWCAEHVLGPLAGVLAEAAPAAVSVVAPAEAGWLLGLPLGVAEVEGRSLAARRVVFAATPEDYRQPPKDPVGERLRVLAVFSVPAGQSLLDLRRERKGLADLVAGMVGGGTSRALDLRVLQYGATPQRLQDALAEGEGWDVVHFSGHGATGRLVLEDDAGRATVVHTAAAVVCATASCPSWPSPLRPPSPAPAA